MRVLLDALDRRLKKSFDEELEVLTIVERVWGGKKNAELLCLAEQEFDVFITMDRTLEYQQNLSDFSIGILLIAAKSNRRKDVEPLMQEVGRALDRAKVGELIVAA
ncbi:MAG: hypothetical protein ACR2GU_03035 [Rubrobacteraceae bacterium]